MESYVKVLIHSINEIVQFGTQAVLIITDKEILLERNLIKIYDHYFNIQFVFDETDYDDYDNIEYKEIRTNVESNFHDFGYYKSILDINDLYKYDDVAMGDAIDDLADIISDLLEIKWRIENNSLADGLWYFQFIFKAHTQQDILDLLNYIKQNETTI